MIEISDLEFRYAEGEFRLRIPELCVEERSTTALIGPSGSGKTTLLSLVAGIAAPLSGRIAVQGTEVSALGDAGRRAFRIRTIGLVFQEFELLEYLSVLDNILLPYRINPTLSLDRGVRERARDLAAQLGIADKLRRHPGRLSQGERQRVALCRAVLPEPALILADEPTGNLDPENSDRVLDLLFVQVERLGATLVTVTHERELLPRFQRVIDVRDLHRAGGAP
jgi:ABC-type lipoprotein export system ATPase subunit